MALTIRSDLDLETQDHGAQDDAGRQVEIQGDPIPLDELLALAEIDVADEAAAANDWIRSASMPGLLDAMEKRT